MRRNLSLITLVATLTACQPPAPAGLGEADVQAIRAADQAAVAAIAAKDWAGWAASFTEQGMIMPPNADAVTGRDGIQAWATGFPPFTDFQAQIEEIEGLGNLAYVRGSYSLTITPPGAAPIPERGKFFYVTRKQTDGSWKVVRDMWNSNLPLPAPAAPSK
jgi:uncharacterized protein (TIGR02246 family)